MLSAVKKELAKQIAGVFRRDPSDLAHQLEVPKSLEHGHLALPVFQLAKELKKAPPLIAQEMATEVERLHVPFVKSVAPVSGFVNFHLDEEYFQSHLISSVVSQAERLGHRDVGNGKRVVIDFSSPNIAKPMHVGHLRSTVIGQALSNLARTQGFEVIGLNYLGDWGVQFGKLAFAYARWASEYDFEKEPFESLYQLYVRFHREVESDPSLEAEGARFFKRLEDGDEGIRELWRKFIDMSLVEYGRVYSLLGTKHDLIRGESFFNEHLKPTEKLLEAKGLLVESEGAMVVKLEEEGYPPCLIRKSDGASLYATRDLASAIHRHDDLKADQMLYVVGMDQTLHFQQVFAVLKRMGYGWVEGCSHVGFGMIRFKDEKMSSRKGQVIRLEDVFRRAIELVKEIIAEKNPSLPDQDKVAEQVGVGAIVFNDLVNDRVKNIEFDWERVLDFEGDSGPYVQYCLVRCRSIMRKAGETINPKMTMALITPEERELFRVLMNYEDALANAYRLLKPHVVAGYLLNVCQVFNHFYHKCRIINEPDDVRQARLTLVWCTARVLESGLSVLNISAPEMM